MTAERRLAKVSVVLNEDNRRDQEHSVVALGVHMPKVREFFASLWAAIGSDDGSDQSTQIAVLLALHKPRSMNLVTAGPCVEEECDHETCPTTPGEVCDHCFGMFERHVDEYAYERISAEVMWPCPTVRALGVTS